MRLANKPPGRRPSPHPATTPQPETSCLSSSLRGPRPRALPAEQTRPATGWLRPRASGDPPGNSASREPAPRRPGASPLPPRPLGPRPGSTTSPSPMRRVPPGLLRALTRPRWAPGPARRTARGARSPGGRRPESLLFTGRGRTPPGSASPFLRFPFC